MRSRLPRWRRGLTASALLVSALGWGACEPLDLALFPVTPDASVPALVEVPAQPPASTQPDAGGDVQSDAGAPPPPSACLPGATACESCVLAAACASGERCHPRSGGCVPSCAEGACPGSLVCDSLDVCVECRDDTQCAGASDEPHCDTLRGVCVECFLDEHCTDDPLERPACLATGICGCASNDDCSGGATCELDEAHCEIEDD